MTKRSIEQQIAQANDRLSRLKARQKKAEARRHILLGATMMDVARMNARNAETLLTLLNQAKLKGAEDRDLAPLIAELTQLKDKTDGTLG